MLNGHCYDIIDVKVNFYCSGRDSMLTMELTLAERIDACDSLIKYFKGDIN